MSTKVILLSIHKGITLRYPCPFVDYKQKEYAKV